MNTLKFKIGQAASAFGETAIVDILLDDTPLEEQLALSSNLTLEYNVNLSPGPHTLTVTMLNIPGPYPDPITNKSMTISLENFTVDGVDMLPMIERYPIKKMECEQNLYYDANTSYAQITGRQWNEIKNELIVPEKYLDQVVVVIAPYTLFWKEKILSFSI